MAGLIAWQALFDYAHLSIKDTIFIHGAARGVGIFTVQLARWAGAYIIGTASAHNSSFLKDLGVNDQVALVVVFIPTVRCTVNSLMTKYSACRLCKVDQSHS